jgi:hypothetical protein
MQSFLMWCTILIYIIQILDQIKLSKNLSLSGWLPDEAGWSAKRLHRIGFFRRDEPDSFGFVDPDQVIRAVHLIPAFEYGRTDTRLAPSFVRPAEDHDQDFLYFYINQYVFLSKLFALK